jgi:hypothetical protein
VGREVTEAEHQGQAEPLGLDQVFLTPQYSKLGSQSGAWYPQGNNVALSQRHLAVTSVYEGGAIGTQCSRARMQLNYP